ncbi:MAG: AbrB/MazE/SpoVT family DNA-binding domain-containing protein [Myxococcota bacterium]|nr:AbrB/MazE/SpoVT family DNA-binding domain-containing protein [Myxococcota bacterium]MDW8363959.1 AbrB/MazE/SpoVT family DNA-binding domain-containing protein [Myxococcales bacterium]
MMPARTKLSALGNGWGIVIDEAFLERLAIDRDTELAITTDGRRLVIEPIAQGSRERLANSARRVMDAHDATLRKLAR